MQKVILFVCTRNASRSQMGEAFFNFYNTNSEFVAKSAGVDPASQINPAVIELMKEKNIDMTGQYPKLLTLEMAEEAYKIIRLCGKDACVWAPEAKPRTELRSGTGEKTEDWNLEDPLGNPIEKVREIRDIIDAKVASLVREISLSRN